MKLKWRIPTDRDRASGLSFFGYFPQRLGYIARQEIITIHYGGWGGGCWQCSSSGHNIMETPAMIADLPDPQDVETVWANLFAASISQK